MWAAHLLYPKRPMVMIAGTDSNVREFLALYDHEFPRLRLKQLDISHVKHLTIVDCSSRSQLKKIEGLLDRKDITVEVWDHHRKDGPEFHIDDLHFADVGANTSVLVLEMIKRGLHPSPEEATLLLLGIYEDTGSLRFPTTTPVDLEAAAWLLRSGASLVIADKFLGIKMTVLQKNLLSELGLNVRVVEVRGLEIHFTTAVVDEFVDEIAYMARKVQETENADVLFAMVQLNDRVFIVGRSRVPAVNVSTILSAFGGGGHPQAASCLLTGTTHPVAMQRLLDSIREQVMPLFMAKDIMSSPVRSVSPDTKIEDAHTIIAHTGYSGLVVLDDDNEIVGVITRSGIDKAIQHGLGHAPVKGYMTKDPEIVTENVSLREILNVIIEKRAGFLPVISGGHLTGVVTRSDVLQAIHNPAVVTDPGTEDTDGLSFDEFGKNLLIRLPAPALDLLAIAGELADDTGVMCYLVGGIVRDLIIKRENHDIDLLIEGNGIEFAHRLALPLSARVVESERFRTAKVMLDDGSTIDVATARDEFYTRPGALPEVEAAGIRDDLVRRDFTINTLAIQLNTRKWGHFVDHFGGVGDLHDRFIRVLHTFSFVDDPTRILRALRFSERFDLQLEKQTSELLNRALLEGRLDDISPQRVRDELILCMEEDKPWQVIKRLFNEGVIGVLGQSIYSPDEFPDIDDPVVPTLEWISKFLSDDEVPSKLHSYMSLFLSGAAMDDAVNFVRHFKFDNEIIHIAEGQSEFREICRLLSESVEKSSDLVHALENLPKPCWVSLAAGVDDDHPKRTNLKKYLTELRQIKLDIDGNDLIKAGYKPGSEFKEVLGKVRSAKIDGEVSGWDAEMGLARKLMGEV